MADLAQRAAPTALTHREILVVFSGLLSGMLLAALDQTIVSTSLPRIVGDLGGLDHLSWVVTAYMLTSTASTPLYGKISDLLGRKIVFQAAIVIFLAGSVLCGFAQDMVQLILARGVQGLGAGGLVSLAMAIIGDVIPARERGRYQGYLGSVWALSSIAGPLIGGFLVDGPGWRWIFFINIPIGIGALIVTSSVLNLEFHRVQHKIDYLGAALLVAGVSCVLLVTVWGGSEYPWSSPTIIGLAAAGTVLLGLFLFQETRAPEPILPLRLFRNSVFLVTTSVLFLVGLGMFGAMIFLPLYLQVVGGASATESGLLLVPMMAGIMATTITSGRAIARTGRYKVFPLVGSVILFAGFALLARLGSGSARWEVVAAMVVVGVGVGLIMQVMILAVQNAVDYRDLGVATSSANFFRSMGGSFGVAIFGAIMASRLAVELPRLLPRRPGMPAVDIELIRGGPERIAELPAAAQAAVTEAFARAIHVVFLTALPAAAAVIVIVWFLKEIPLRDTAHVGNSPASD